MFTNKFKGVSKLLHIRMWYDCQNETTNHQRPSNVDLSSSSTQENDKN